MRTAIPFQGGELEAQLAGEVWIVRLGELEARSKWLDFALSQLLDDDTQKAHELAAKLEEQLLAESETAAAGSAVTNGAGPGPGPVTEAP